MLALAKCAGKLLLCHVLISYSAKVPASCCISLSVDNHTTTINRESWQLQMLGPVADTAYSTISMICCAVCSVCRCCKVPEICSVDVFWSDKVSQAKA